ncbi:hypothetical protein [Halorientalis pallida]|uniref:Uncharacterized protein n=1 Tax=Halorientalis pallida TaxID=2479928 RepID=A0A498KZX2_9EURY|nr:hypothetical protein [Halorientalis pallida]RXK51276.1 hypothetical protein EAF64_01145 [Halorientalis pallida]
MTGKSAIEGTESPIPVAVLCCLLVAVPVAGVAGGLPAAQATDHATPATASVGVGGVSLGAVPLAGQTNESSVDDTDAGTGNDSDGDESSVDANRTENTTSENETADDESAEEGTTEGPPSIESYTATVEGTNRTVRVERSDRLRRIAVGVYDIEGGVVAERASHFVVGTEYVTTFEFSAGTYRSSLIDAKSHDRQVEDPTSHYAVVTVSDAATNRTTTPESSPTETPTTVATERPTTSAMTPTSASSATETKQETRRTVGTTPPATEAAPADDPGPQPRPRTQGALFGSPLLQSVLTLATATVLTLLSVVLWVRG